MTGLRHFHDAYMYEYKSLDRKRKQIRLLTVQPGTGDGILCCALSTTYLDTQTPPHYETVSYVCGDQTIKATIDLHGSKYQALASSEDALRCLRLEDRPRTLWIDSICINQANIDERGHQVGLMYEIYTHTSHNCVCLGPDHCNMLKVIESMRLIHFEIHAETRDHFDFAQMLFGPGGASKLSDVPFSIDIKHSGLIEFFENPWFLRLWVVQEASLSRTSTCYCGEHQLSLTDVLRVAAWLSYKWNQMPTITNAQARGILNAVSIFDSADRRYGFHHNRQTMMWDLLSTFDEFHSSNRKDQVYALVALWQMHTQTPELPAMLTPNYKLSVSKIFGNATKFAIEEAEHLLLLRKVYASSREKESGSWASWVPVLDHRMGVSASSNWIPFPTIFVADDELPMLLSDGNAGSDILEVMGLLLDEVTQVTSIPAPLEVSVMFDLMHSLEEPRPRPSWVEGDIQTRAALVLQAGIANNAQRAPSDTASQRYQSLKKYLKRAQFYPPPPSSMDIRASASDKAASSYAAAVSLVVPHRAVFHTKDGHMGLGPECCRPGDIVAILFGCQWPVVMRPLPTPGEYTFLECAYVYGIMDGEAVRRHDEMGGEDDRFVIV